MPRRLVIAAAAALALAACATAPEVESEPIADVTEPGDPWAMAIEAERYGYLITLAKEGVVLAQTEPIEDHRSSGDLEERARRALHDAAHELYALRERVCDDGLVAAEVCAARLDPPDWLGEPADARVDGVEVQRRIDWLVEHMQPFVEAGCDAGQSVTDPDLPHYCSVE